MLAGEGAGPDRHGTVGFGLVRPGLDPGRQGGTVLAAQGFLLLSVRSG